MFAGLHASAPTSRVQRALLVTFAALHLLQLASPLRLNTDAVVYLSLGHGVFGPSPWSFDGQPPHFPPGYPLLLAGLEWLGWLHPASLVALNLASVALACLCADGLLRRDYGLGSAVAGATLLCMLGSWVLVKHAALPLSDVPYLGLSFAALAALEHIARTGGPVRVALALALALLAASARYVGLALLPAAAWALFQRLPAARRNRRTLVVTLSLAAGLAALVGTRMFVGVALATRPEGNLLAQAWATALYRLDECGELLLNLPLSRFETVRNVLFPPCGLLACVLVARGRRAVAGGLRVGDVYLLGYLAMLAVWPHYEPRLWVPLLPFFYAWLLSGIAALPPGVLPFVRLQAWAYAALGLVALAFSVRLTLAGARFPEIFGNGSLRAVYQVAWGQRWTPREWDPVESAALDILRRIEPRARHERRQP